jgi:hypothetical protein
LDKEFFAKTSVKQDDDEGDEQGEPTPGKRKVAKRPRADQAKLKAKRAKAHYWRFHPALKLVERLALEKAHAECQNCDGGGGGGEGGGGGGGGGGEEAAGILFGLAAIITAIAPVMIAKTQAEADIQITKINTKSQLDMTQISADTSKFLANKQEEIALRQADIAKGISQTNNDFQTKRLDMQLSELRSAREDARQAERERQAIEQQYNQERIALANKQANDNLRLARETLNSNLTQAGLTSGFATSANTGNRLSVASTTAGGATFSGLPAAGGGGGAATGLGAGGGLPGGGLGGASNAELASNGAGGDAGGGGGQLGFTRSGTPTVGKTGSYSTAIPSTATKTAAASGPRGIVAKVSPVLAGASGAAPTVVASNPVPVAPHGTDRLLAGLKTADFPSTTAAKRGVKGKPLTRPVRVLRGIAGLRSEAAQRGGVGPSYTVGSVGRELQKILDRNGSVRGSTSRRRMRVATTKEPTDLSKFMSRAVSGTSVRSDDEADFAGYVERSRAARGAEGTPHVERQRYPGAYNEPGTPAISNESAAGLFGNSTHGGN